MRTDGTEGTEADPDDIVFRALSDPTRRRILQALACQDLPAGQVAALFPIAGPSVSRHLTVLRSAGLVRERRDGNRRICSLAPGPLIATLNNLARDVGLDGLAPSGSASPTSRKKKVKPSEILKKKNKKDKSRADIAVHGAGEGISDR